MMASNKQKEAHHDQIYHYGRFPKNEIQFYQRFLNESACFDYLYKAIKTAYRENPMKDRLNSDQALKRLMDGNKRYITSRSIHPHHTRERRIELKNGQNPFAVILGCS